MVKTPILFIIFNRPDTTRKVFAAIRRAKPKKLFIAADGPRRERIGEKEKCGETRIITENVDWPCKVKRLYRENNLGCKLAVSSAIDWFFKNVEEGIILEDDCLPHPSFFKYCADLLNKYRSNNQIMHISGDNFLFNKVKIIDSYYFSRISHVWGWATWRRAWKKYDVNMKDWPKFKRTGKLFKMFSKRIFSTGWNNIFDKVYQSKIDTWDYQWTYTILKNGGYCINPGVNLVSNIGFTKLATHTKTNSMFAAMQTEILNVKNYSIKVEFYDSADNYVLHNVFGFSNTRHITGLVRGVMSKIFNEK